MQMLLTSSEVKGVDRKVFVSLFPVISTAYFPVFGPEQNSVFGHFSHSGGSQRRIQNPAKDLRLCVLRK